MKFMENKLKLKSDSYLWAGLTTFAFGCILHDEIQHNIVDFYSGFNFINQLPIITVLYGLCFGMVLLIFIDNKLYPTDYSNNPDLFLHLNETFLREWASENAKKHGGIKLIRLYKSPTIHEKYHLYLKLKKFYRTKFYRNLLSGLLKSKAKNTFLYPLKDAYRSDPPVNWQDEWVVDTELANTINRNS